VEEGYGARGVIDASISPFDLLKATSQWRMQAAGVVSTATNAVIAALADNRFTPAGQKLIRLLFIEVIPPIQVSNRKVDLAAAHRRLASREEFSLAPVARAGHPADRRVAITPANRANSDSQLV
jgi:hypothetical protein